MPQAIVEENPAPIPYAGLAPRRLVYLDSIRSTNHVKLLERARVLSHKLDLRFEKMFLEEIFPNQFRQDCLVFAPANTGATCNTVLGASQNAKAVLLCADNPRTLRDLGYQQLDFVRVISLIDDDRHLELLTRQLLYR
ncbi:MAG: hypothetical protein U0514_02160 [Candidatus Andersenbacteria bacterium]